MNERRFCVYQHIDRYTGFVKYVGSGTRSRVTSRTSRSREHMAAWKDLQFIIVKENLTLVESRNLEQQIMNLFKSENLFNLLVTTAKPLAIKYNDISALLEYDSTSPTLLRWKVDRKSLRGFTHRSAGSVAGYLDTSKGYVKLKINGKKFSAHRIIYSLFYKTDIPENLVIDHIDRNRSNNLPENLKLTTFSNNNKNRKFSDDFNIRKSKSCNSILIRWTDNIGNRKAKSFNFTKQIATVGYEKAYRDCYQMCLKIREQIEENLANGDSCEQILQAYSGNDK